MATFLETSTSQQQHALELKVADLYQDFTDYEQPERDELLVLLRDRHARYLQNGLGELPGGFISLNASRPWLCYWIVHGLALLEQPLPRNITAEQVIAFLSSCQHPDGGYAGGPGQMPHLAPTYSAICALLTLGGEAAYRSINRDKLWIFLCRMVIPPEQGGGFRMHEGGECDARSCYTALAVANSLCLDVPELVRRSGVVDYLRRCQTYEGGLGGEPGNEAHGGYTFCGLAALIIAGCPEAVDLPRLLHWAVQRQGSVEGGFNGRTNKLVDGCYSFWQGGTIPLVQQVLQQQQQQQQQQQEAASNDKVPVQLSSICCDAPTYTPRVPPESWQQQQRHELVVPELPDLSKVVGPLQQAQLDSERLNATCDMLTQAAVAAAAAATQQQHGEHENQGQQQQQQQQQGVVAAADNHALSRREILQRAQAAQQAAELADEKVAIAVASAALLYPCQVTSAAAAAAAATSDATPSSSSSSGTNAAAAADAANPLFNTRALQLWLLRACQQLKGGLRDKPGKSADYYHTCYCLSGLAVAQHMPGGGVLGAEGNEVLKADPIMNILVERMQEAREYFSQV